MRSIRSKTFSSGLKRLFGAAVLSLAAGGAQADPMTMPAMAAGPLTANPNPTALDTGFGNIYVTGAVSGLAFYQSNPAHLFSGDSGGEADLDNGQVFIQKTDGSIQFFAQAGIYSLPALGASYIKSSSAVGDFYGALPQAFVKIVPNENFSVMAGKLPTLIGDEYTFTFENMNIERGLLWNQENAVNRGVQANYTSGPLTVSLSWNDGFYSNRFNWLSGAVSYTVGSSDAVAVVGMGNVGRTAKATLSTPFFQNNSDIYNLIWTHTDGPWVFSPYLQYTHVPADASLGIAHSASTIGGAILASYAFDDNFKLAARAEYIGSTGTLGNGAPSLLYGPGSNAWSLTLTPTYQYKQLFARAEASYVKITDGTPGFELGSTFGNTSQVRALLEIGILF